MTTPGLFVVGVLVTLIVAAALALLTYGAILDGRYATERKREHEEDMRDQAAAMREQAETESSPMVTA